MVNLENKDTNYLKRLILKGLLNSDEYQETTGYCAKKNSLRS